jgi:hypothetical protein
MLVSTDPAARCLITVAFVALGATGCSDPFAPDRCTAQFVYGLSVIVQDKATGLQICDAQVTARVSETEVEILKPQVFLAECSYGGAGERPGVYFISVTKDGYAPATRSNVRVDKGDCHVIPVRVTIALDRELN